MDKSTERRLVENEVLFRAANTKVQKRIINDHRHHKGLDTTKIHFYCECSDIQCKERIITTAREYGKAHTAEKYFITLPGHENLAIEKIIQKSTRYSIVEKYMDPAEVVQAR